MVLIFIISSVPVSTENFCLRIGSPFSLHIKSPFLLNLTFDGVLLGDALDDALTRLPQREKWQSSQLNLKLKQKFIFILKLYLFYCL